MKKLKKFSYWSLVIGIYLGFGIWNLEFAKAATPKPTPFPTSPYTCIQNKYTCTTENTCEIKASGSYAGTCPRAEICCIALRPTTPPGLINSPTPSIRPLKYWPCGLTGPEYHPLRPYPASPCNSPLIPRKSPEAVDDPNLQYLTFSCGKSANPQGTVNAPDVVTITEPEKRFPPLNSGSLLCGGPSNMENCKYQYLVDNFSPHSTYPMLCDDFSETDPSVCFLAKVVFNVALDYSDAIFPILGNTLDRKLTDRNKLNRYLSWYLNGAVLSSENQNLNLSKITDKDRLINFSGPVYKLFSKETLVTLRETMQIYDSNIHNYEVGGSRVTSANTNSSLFEIITTEDTTGEVQPSLVIPGQPTSPEIDGRILRISLSIGSADSRLYFPHLKNTNALSQLLTGTFRPVSTPPRHPNPKDRDLVVQRISLFQGIQDTTKTFYPTPDPLTPIGMLPVVNRRVRNTEVIPFSLPPSPLFLDYSSRFPSVSDQRCDIKNAIGGSGDSLIGQTINTTLTFYQAFKYQPKRIIIYAGTPISCSDFKLTYQSSPTSCKDYQGTDPRPQSCTSNAGEACTSDGPNTDGTCCWDKCPNLTPCEKDSLYNSCVNSGIDCRAVDLSYVELSSLSCDTYGFKCCGPSSTYTGSGGICEIASFDPTNPSCSDCVFETSETECKSLSCCRWVPGTTNVTPAPKVPRAQVCPSWPNRDLKTMGRIAIFVKTPFVEKLYDTLVASTDSLLRRILPYRAGQSPPPPDQPVTDYLKTGSKTVPGFGSANYTATYSASGVTVNNTKVSAGDGGGPALYYPRIGSLFDYLLGSGKDPLNLQCIFRPQGFCSASKTENKAGICIPTDENVNTAIADTSARYNIPENLLRAIYEIESFALATGYTSPEEFDCSVGAQDPGSTSLGVMQINNGTYNDVACPGEEYIDGSDAGICPSPEGKMSRCDIQSTFDLAARVLLMKIGMWNSATCQPYGSVTWDKTTIYRATKRWHGLCEGNILTYKYNYNMNGPKRPTDNATYGDNYGDLILNKLGFVNSLSDYPSQCPL